MFNRILRLAKNPTVQKIAVWLGPIILGWIMTKFEESGKQSSSSSKKNTRSKR